MLASVPEMRCFVLEIAFQNLAQCVSTTGVVASLLVVETLTPQCSCVSGLKQRLCVVQGEPTTDAALAEFVQHCTAAMSHYYCELLDRLRGIPFGSRPFELSPGVSETVSRPHRGIHSEPVAAFALLGLGSCTLACVE